MSGILWWTPARLEAVRALAAGGKQAPEIARELTRRFRRRITRDAVSYAAKGNGIRLPRGRPLKSPGQPEKRKTR